MCDTAVVVTPERVLFAKNSDRDPNEAQLLDWQSRQQHVPGARLRCTWIEIPQTEATHAVLLSRPYWMWGAEMGANEHSVVIGNEAVFTRHPVPKLGLTGMDLLRLALERSASAEEAVSVIVSLIDEHGQGGGCGHEQRSFRYHSSFLIADAAGAFVLETAGEEHAVERIQQGARSISNGLSIQPFARNHGDRIKTFAASAGRRRRRSERLAVPARCPSDMAAVLGDHDHVAGPRYTRLNGAMRAACMHAGGGLVNSQTTASWLSELTAGSDRHWATGTAAPCTSLFVPVRVDEPVDLGAAATDRADPTSLWWAHERVHRLIDRDPGRLLPLLEPERADLQRRFDEADLASAEAFKLAAEARTSWTERLLDATGPDRRAKRVQRYWSERAERSGFDASAASPQGSVPASQSAQNG